MKLKVILKEKKNLNEVDTAKVAELRRRMNKPSAIERELEVAFKKAEKSPQEFFNVMQQVIQRTKKDLQKLASIFPTMPRFLETINKITIGAAEDAEDIEDFGDDIEDALRSDEKESGEEEDAFDNIELEEAEKDIDYEKLFQFVKSREDDEEKSKKLGKVLDTLNFSSIAKLIGNTPFEDLIKSYQKDLAEGLKAIAKKGTDPVNYFINNPQLAMDLRGVYQIINLSFEFSKVILKVRSRMAGLYKKGREDPESIINAIEKNPDILLNNFKEEFKHLKISPMLAKGQQTFNNFFIGQIFQASDVATGGGYAKQVAAVGRAGSRLDRLKKAGAVREEVLGEQDADVDAAMKDLQSDPLTQTFDEYEKQAKAELKSAASKEKIDELTELANKIVTAFASKHRMRDAQHRDFKVKFINLINNNFDKAAGQLERIMDFFKEDIDNILDGAIEPQIKRWIKLRQRVKKANISPERAAAYIEELNNTIKYLNKLRKDYGLKHLDTINKNPANYAEFLEDVEAALSKEFPNIEKQLGAKFKSIKQGNGAPGEDKKEDEKEKEPGDPNSLKNLSTGKINVALNQLRNKGLGADQITKQINNIANDISKNAGPQRDNFINKDLPVINKIKDEISKILKGDFTNLVKESNNLVYIHPITYDLLKRLSIKFKSKIDYNIKALNENTLNINKYNLIVSQISNLVKSYSEKDKKKLLNFNENKYLQVNSKLSPEAIRVIIDAFHSSKDTIVPLKEECVIKNHSDRDMSHLEDILTQFYPYAKKKLDFEEPVNINLVSDAENSKDPFGKTAYYNPEAMEISIFVDERHPKDMLRSIAHELVHHAQNCRGEFDNVGSTEPGYAQKDSHLRNLEGEAYLLGNGFLVRDYEDLLKLNSKEKKEVKKLTKERLEAVLTRVVSEIVAEEGETTVYNRDEDEESACVEEAEASTLTEDMVEELFRVRKDALINEALKKKWCK